MVIGKTLTKDRTLPGVGLSEVFTEVNRLLCVDNSEGLFISAFEGVLDLETGLFTYVNAIPHIDRQRQALRPYEGPRTRYLPPRRTARAGRPWTPSGQKIDG